MSKHRRNQRGVSLVEVMIAMVVLSVGVLGAMHANVLASNQTGLASRESGASAIGRDLIDSFERLPYEHPALAVGSHQQLDTDYGTTDRPILGAAAGIINSDGKVDAKRTQTQTGVDGGTPTGSRFGVGWNVTEIADGRAKAVEIDVSFTTGVGGNKSAHFRTIKFNPASVTGSSSTKMEEGI